MTITSLICRGGEATDPLLPHPADVAESQTFEKYISWCWPTKVTYPRTCAAAAADAQRYVAALSEVLAGSNETAEVAAVSAEAADCITEMGACLYETPPTSILSLSARMVSVGAKKRPVVLPYIPLQPASVC